MDPNSIADRTTDTIHALSSGAPPAAIAVVRLSGPAARRILAALAGPLPTPRRASVRTLRDHEDDTLDRALVLWFPGPATATGEDLAELHLHGGRAVVAAVLAALASHGSRIAEPGEFTRRALLNGRLDLAEVEGLADLLTAETDYQRREALRRSEGMLGRRLAGWSDTLLTLAARYEAAIDYDGEIDREDEAALATEVNRLAAEIEQALGRASAERLRDGLRVAISGPVNAGKSSLFNALVGSDAAIVSSVPGTTRDLIERPLSIGGMPFVLTDTAGLRHTTDEIERIGIERAIRSRTLADIVIALDGGPEGDGAAAHTIRVTPKSDIRPASTGTIGTSVLTGEGIADVLAAIARIGSELLPPAGDVALSRVYRDGLSEVLGDLREAGRIDDLVIAADHLRHAREALDRLTGSSGFEDMLDALFGRFCLGK